MKHKRIGLAAVITPLVMALSGCVMTVDQMYSPPRRSEGFTNLQTVMDQAMQGKGFSAPISGDNQQPVQLIDLDGDTAEEAVVFTKGTQEKPLSIMIFSRENGEYKLSNTIDSTGSAFEQVDYVQMDGEPGLEMIVGRQVQDQVLRSLTVYKFSEDKPVKLLTASYQKYMTWDMDGDSRDEIIVLNPGRTEAEPGLISSYDIQRNAVDKSIDVQLSRPLNQVKRVVYGTLSGGQQAAFVSSSVDDTVITTDVVALKDSVLTNVTLSAKLDTGMKALRNDFIYPDDIDQDGIMEIPELVEMYGQMPDTKQQEYMIRWSEMDLDGSKTEKQYTYHNQPEGWYVDLPDQTAERMNVISEDSGRYSFHLWNEEKQQYDKLWTLYILTGSERSAQAAENHRFVLTKTDNVVYAGELEDEARLMGVNEDHLKRAFHLIQSDWKTGEM